MNHPWWDCDSILARTVMSGLILGIMRTDLLCIIVSYVWTLWICHCRRRRPVNEVPASTRVSTTYKTEGHSPSINGVFPLTLNPHHLFYHELAPHLRCKVHDNWTTTGTTGFSAWQVWGIQHHTDLCHCTRIACWFTSAKKLKSRLDSFWWASSRTSSCFAHQTDFVSAG